MVPDPALMKAVETLDYRVTTGDIASQAGLDIKYAERGLLALASSAGGHMQVSETGDIVYLFPPNFRAILRSRSFRLRMQETWQKIWNVLFYLIRISFGILLILSLVIIAIAITTLIIVSQQGQRSEGRSQRGSNVIIFPFWLRGGLFDVFRPGYYRRRRRGYPYGTATQRQTRGSQGNESELNFLEAVFSFLFGDGDPNADLSDRRWQEIATVIRNNGGAVAAEQILPYLDIEDIPDEDEDYMLPVLIRFNGRPQVSPDGHIIYHFPELQVMAEQHGKQRVPEFLKEREWQFSQASSTQLTWAGGLGAANFLGAIVLGLLLIDLDWGEVAAEVGSGVIGLVAGGYGVILLYAIAFVTIPTVRYFWIKRKNQAIEHRNQKRLQWSKQLDSPSEIIQKKIAYAHQFAAETVISPDDLAYTTESDLMEQEALNSDKIDEEWRKRLEGLL